MPASERFQQLALRFTDPVQHDYEVIRGIFLTDETITERSRETGLDRATVAAKARCFLEQGMRGLLDRRTTPGKKGHSPYPEGVAGYLLYLKQLYPPIHLREMARIVERKFGCKTNHHTLQQFLRRHAFPVQLPLPVTTFHQFEDAYLARWTVVRLWYEGWHQQSIAGYLQLSRKHVREILVAFQRDGFAGLEDQRTRPSTHPANQLTLPFLAEVLAVQRDYPRAGRFRVRGLVAQRTGPEPPSERTVGRAMALNRQHHGAPPAWTTDRPDPAEPDGIVKDMPYALTHRHRYWFIDIRYLVRIGSLNNRSDREDAAQESQETPENLDQEDMVAEHWVYSLCIIEGYSRKILAGMASPYQDVVAVLQLLSAALSAYGRPEGIVSDNGSVFTSDAYECLLAALGIEVCHIEKGKPWQNLIEAQFKIELRLADAAFEQAATLAEIQERHATFVETFNTTPHWAHRERADGLRTPEETLGWVQGRELAPDALLRALRQLQVARTVNRAGYVSVQRFYLYAERGLARKRVSVWLYDGRLHLAYQQALLAQYTYHAERRGKQLQAVDPHPQLYRTAYASPQLELWELDDVQWRKVFERRPYQRHPPQAPEIPIQQLALPMVGLAVVLLLAIVG
jgi:transposase InsO family protein